MPWKEKYTVCDEQSMPDGAVEWPGKRQCAAGIVVDLRVKLDVQDPGVKGGQYRVQGHPKNIELKIENDLAEYGMKIGLPRLFDLFEAHGIKATFAVPGIMAEMFPECVQGIVEQGHEVAAQGYRAEHFANLGYEEEKKMLEDAGRVIEEICGKRPDGWFFLPRQQDLFAGGEISPNTVDLLIDAGYEYLGNGMADDIPFYWVTNVSRRRTMLSLPYYFHLDDQFFLMFPSVGSGTGLENPAALFQNWKEEFEATYQRGRYFPVVVHPDLIGWGNHLELFEEILRHMKSFPGVWFTTGGECARYWKDKYPASTSLKLE
jgi:peptidoglycan-N-acetylglucosamine deacetylase